MAREQDPSMQKVEKSYPQGGRGGDTPTKKDEAAGPGKDESVRQRRRSHDNPDDDPGGNEGR